MARPYAMGSGSFKTTSTARLDNNDLSNVLPKNGVPKMPGNRIDHALMVSLNVLLLTVVGVALLAYQVSPLRDPSFIPQAANAGARVSWLNPEKYWMAAIRIFSIALATNISLLTWSQLRGNRDGIVRFTRNPTSTALKVLGLCGVWLVVFYSFWYFSLLFLLWQYIID